IRVKLVTGVQTCAFRSRQSTARSPGVALGEVVDLFCGVGALSHGLKRAGFKIVAGYDTDARCKYAFEKNNDAIFYVRDVAKLGEIGRASCRERITIATH